MKSLASLFMHRKFVYLIRNILRVYGTNVHIPHTLGGSFPLYAREMHLQHFAFDFHFPHSFASYGNSSHRTVPITHHEVHVAHIWDTDDAYEEMYKFDGPNCYSGVFLHNFQESVPHFTYSIIY